MSRWLTRSTQRLRQNPSWDAILEASEHFNDVDISAEIVDRFPDGEYVLYPNVESYDVARLRVERGGGMLVATRFTRGQKLVDTYNSDGILVDSRLSDSETGDLLAEKYYNGNIFTRVSYYQDGEVLDFYETGEGTDNYSRYSTSGQILSLVDRNPHDGAPSEEHFYHNGNPRSRFWYEKDTAGGLLPGFESYYENGGLKKRLWEPTSRSMHGDNRYRRGLPAVVEFNEDGEISQIVYAVRDPNYGLQEYPKPDNALPLNTDGLPDDETAIRLFGVDSMTGAVATRENLLLGQREKNAIAEVTE